MGGLVLNELCAVRIDRLDKLAGHLFFGGHVPQMSRDKLGGHCPPLYRGGQMSPMSPSPRNA